MGWTNNARPKWAYSMLFTKGAVRSICAMSILAARRSMNIKMNKRLTTFALVIALMTGSVAQLAVLLYRGARIIAVSSLSFAADIASPEWREQDRLTQKKEKIFKRI